MFAIVHGQFVIKMEVIIRQEKHRVTLSRWCTRQECEKNTLFNLNSIFSNRLEPPEWAAYRSSCRHTKCARGAAECKEIPFRHLPKRHTIYRISMPLCFPFFSTFACSRPAEDFFFSFHSFYSFPFVFFFFLFFFLFRFFVLREHENGTKKEKLNARKFLVVCFVLIIETHRISLNVHKYKIIRTILG